MPRIAGGCLCGAVRYRSEAEPLMQVICHCKTCRKNSGSAFSMNVAVPQDSLTLEGGETRRYEDRSGSSGQPFYRQYCAKCGSHVYSHGAAYGALAFGHLMTRQGSRQPCISGAPKSSRGFKFQKGPPRFPGNPT